MVEDLESVEQGAPVSGEAVEAVVVGEGVGAPAEGGAEVVDGDVDLVR